MNHSVKVAMTLVTAWKLSIALLVLLPRPTLLALLVAHLDLVARLVLMSRRVPSIERVTN